MENSFPFLSMMVPAIFMNVDQEQKYSKIIGPEMRAQIRGDSENQIMVAMKETSQMKSAIFSFFNRRSDDSFSSFFLLE